MADTTRRVAIAGVHNLRDLGGYQTVDGGETQWGRAYRSCAMRSVPEESRRSADALGISTVIDLRSAEEATATPGPIKGAQERHSMPLFDTLAPAFEMLKGNQAGDLSPRYVAAIESRAGTFADIVGIVANAPEGAVMFHCTAGKDRTGLVAAMLLSLAGVRPSDIAADYARTGIEAADLVDEIRQFLLAEGRDPAVTEQLMSSDAPVMLKILDKLESEYGGARAYLASGGASAAEMDAVVTRLTAP